MPQRLTAEYLNQLPAASLKAGRATTIDVPDSGRGAVAGLRLRVTSGGAKTWVLLARFPGGKRNGKHNPTRRAIGSWPAVTLAEARETASSWNILITKGIDPKTQSEVEQAEREKKALDQARLRDNTFASMAEEFIRRDAAKKRTAKSIARLVRRDLIKRWGDRPVSEIGKGDVIRMVEQVAEQNGTYAAHQCFVYTRRIYNWALKREDPKKPVLGITSNPCTFVDVNDLAGRRKARQRVLTDREIALIWEATEGEPLAVYPDGQFIRLLLILGVRRGEMAAATWGEFDLTQATWALAESRTKNEEARVLPLPKIAVEILATLPRFSEDHLFSTTRGEKAIANFGKVKDRLDRKIAKLNGGAAIAPWRLHDLRRSMRTNLSAIASISPLVAELMIGHRQQGILAVYDQHRYAKEQREGFEAWASRLRSIVEPAPANVVALRP
jgi:integrase